MNKKRAIVLLGAVAAVYLAVWLIVPVSRYSRYREAAAASGFESHVDSPGLFSFTGEIELRKSAYAALVVQPGLFSEARFYLTLEGVGKSYHIEVDRELIPLRPVNEETELLLDESRDELLEMLSWVEENLNI